MGKFDGVLFFTDYDDTLYNTQLTVSPENRAAARYFMDNGGRFSIATGRAHRTFTPQIAKEHIEFNAPVILSNGAAIYDYENERYIERTVLKDTVPALLADLCGTFPELGFEAYHGEDIYVHNPNEVTRLHLERVAAPFTLCPPEDMPTPWNKVILEQNEPVLKAASACITEHWGGVCEAIFSNKYLLELTDKGSTKGSMAAKVADLLGIDPHHMYCIGDNRNDLSMLELSAIPFAPANCSPEVREWGAHILCHTDDHAIAAAIALLDSIY